MFQLKPWTRLLALWQAALILMCAGFLLMLWCWQLQWTGFASLVQAWIEGKLYDEGMQIDSLVFLSLSLLIGWNLWILWCLNRPGVHAQFRQTARERG